MHSTSSWDVRRFEQLKTWRRRSGRLGDETKAEAKPEAKAEPMQTMKRPERNERSDRILVSSHRRQVVSTWRLNQRKMMSA